MVNGQKCGKKSRIYSKCSPDVSRVGGGLRFFVTLKNTSVYCPSLELKPLIGNLEKKLTSDLIT